MADKDNVGIELEADLRKWSRGIDSALNDLKNLDKQLDKAVSAANTAEMTLNSIKTDVDTKVKVDTGEIDTAKRTHDGLKEDVSFNVDATLSSVDSQLKDIIEAQKQTVSVDADLGTIDEKLDKLLTLQVLEIAVNVTTSGVGAVGGLVGNLIDPLVDTENAVAAFEGRAGTAIDDIGDKINNVYTQAWGDSREEVALVMAKLVTDLNAPADELETLTARVLDVSNVMDADFSEVISSTAAMVKSGLVPDFETAFDVLVAGQENGLNRAGDLLDTFREYSTTFTDMGIDAEGALNLMNSGLEAGIDNTDRIADAVREFGIRSTTDLATKMPFYEQIGLGDEAELRAQGKISGEELMNGVLDALSETDDQAVRDLIQDELFGTISEDFGAEALRALGDVKEEITLVGDEAENSSTRLNNTLGTSLTTIERTLQQKAADFFNDEFDFTTFTENIQTAINGIFTDIGNGQDLISAMAFNLDIAFDDTKLGEIFDTLIDALLLAAESITRGIAAAVDAIPGADATGIQSVAEDIAVIRFKADLGEMLGEADQKELEKRFQEFAERGVAGPEAVDAMKGALETNMQRGMSSAEIENALTEFGPIIESAMANNPEIADAMSGTMGRLTETAIHQFNSDLREGNITSALNLGQALVERGVMDEEDVADLTQQVTDRYIEVLSNGISPENIGEIPGLFSAISNGMDADSQAAEAGVLGDAIEGFVRQAIADADFESATAGVDILSGLGEDTSSLSDALDDAKYDYMLASQDILSEQDKIDAAIANMGSITSTMTPSEEEKGALETAMSAMGLVVSTTTADMEDDTKSVEDAINNMGDIFDTRSGDMEGDLTGLRTTAQTELDQVGIEYADTVAGWLINSDIWMTNIDTVIKKLDEFAAAVNSSPEVSTPVIGGGARKIDQNAEGGVTQGWSWVGEEGPELIFNDERMAVLNNDTSMALAEAMSGMGDSRTINNNFTQVINTSARVPDTQVAEFAARLGGYN